MTMFIDDHTNGSEDGQVQIAVSADGTLEDYTLVLPPVCLKGLPSPPSVLPTHSFAVDVSPSAPD